MKLKANAVQLHPATDLWMSGDRYGSIVATRMDGATLVRLDKSDKLVWVAPRNIYQRFSRA